MLEKSYLFISPAALRRALACAFILLSTTGTPARAGDILRGNTTAAAQPPGTVPVYGATAATTAQARAAANDSLSRATQALMALRVMQTAARAIAVSQPSSVPNGLATGGLVPDSGLASQGVAKPVTTWVGASTPTQTTTGGQTTVNITQTAQQAVLNWQSFNIGKSTTVNIDQSAGGANVTQWIAFNIITDPTGIPAQILGSIHALGQVYLIDQNGIIFGGASQVNVNTLVASSLPINTNLISLGLLNNPDDQFLFSQLTIPAVSGGATPAFNPPALPNTPTGRDGDVTVQAGAQLNATDSADNVGGRIALIGPNVTNAGEISTPDGQTILAAGNQVGFVAHPTTDPSLRGLDVFIGSVDQYSGNATNSGVIEAPRGDTTIAGEYVNQLGGIDSTTSVSLNGRVDLLANYDTVITSFNNAIFETPSESGVVTLGAGSVTQILPQLADPTVVVGSSLALPSIINMQGEAIHLVGNATVLAPNASVTLSAGNWLPLPDGEHTFVYASGASGGQIYLDADALIDVAGSTDVSASVTQNIVAAQLLSAELADSPLQRYGILDGATVEVDITQTGIFDGTPWVGTPVADVSGYVNLVEHNVGELTTNGGSVTLNAGGSVVMQPGSTVNVSGGWIDYQGGMVQTTELISGGQIYDISEAPPNIVYQGIVGSYTVNDAKWGVSQSFNSPLVDSPYYEAGYIEGGNGGSITIQAPSLALDGNLVGNTVAGPRQRAIAPDSSSLALLLQAQETADNSYTTFSPTPPAITFQSGAINQTPVAPFALDPSGNPLPIPASRQDEVILSPDLVNSDGFSSLSIYNGDGNITVPANVTLAPPTGLSSLERDSSGNLINNASGDPISVFGGNIAFSAANIDIEGQVIAPGGNLSFNVYDYTPYKGVLVSTPSPNPLRGDFTLGSDGSLDTAGLIVDDAPGAPAPFTLPLQINGGSVSIVTYSAFLLPGSSIDVSGGVEVSASDKISYGKAGAISIISGQDPNIPSILGGELELDASLTGFSGGSGGGSLTIQAPLVQIGGTASSPGTLLLSPNFFSQGGFTNFAITGIGEQGGGGYIPGVLIPAGIQIDPVAENWLAMQNASNNTILSIIQLGEGVRAPVNLSFNALGATDPFLSTVLVVGDFVMQQGAGIQVDPGGGVKMAGNTVTVLGSVVAPGGSITIAGASSYPSSNVLTQPLPTVDIGPKAVLSAAGTVVITPDFSGNNYIVGSVLPGGTITITGNIVAQAGAKIDVSGATGVLDLPPAASGMASPIPSLTSPSNGTEDVLTRIDSNGGSIILAGAQELYTDATLTGAAGGPSALGGSLSVSSGHFVEQGVLNEFTPLDFTLEVTQSGLTIPTAYSTAQNIIGNTVPASLTDDFGNPVLGIGHIAADSFDAGGFASLSMNGSVRFSGNVTLTTSLSLSIANGGVLLADPTVPSSITLDAPYVALGTGFQAPEESQQIITPFTQNGLPFSILPTYGAASLNVNASLIDIGYLSLRDIGQANFTADDGDIRGDGGLDVAGNIYMRAGQIYPPTEVSFTIAAYDYKVGTVTEPGTVTIVASGNRDLPLSAGGELNIYGSIINQDGVLRAPIGVINLGWDGTGSGPVDLLTGQEFDPTQQLTLGAASVTSVSAVDPSTGKGLIIPYGINLNGISWIDPSGVDITEGGVPAKQVNLSAGNINEETGAVVDIAGGGDLYAYRWVQGLGGNNDILSPSYVPDPSDPSYLSYAIIPGYQAGYAPYAPYNTDPITTNLGTDPGYTSNLQVGGQIWLAANNGLAAGVYTLLPARYALLPGAYLVTEQSGNVPSSAVVNPDGSSVVPGYVFNGLATGRTSQPLLDAFEVDPQSVVDSRAEYDNFYANSYLSQQAIASSVAVPRLPVDAGQLVLTATSGMNLQGQLLSTTPGGLGGLVDIGSPSDIYIEAPGQSGPAGSLTINATSLSDFGAASLLVGGIRDIGADGTTVDVTTNNLTVNNAGAPLTGQDIILVANDSLTLAPNAEITASTTPTTSAETLLLGNSSVAGSGDGLLLRVSSDPLAQSSRTGVASQTVQAGLSNPPVMTIGAGATITGESVTLDSSYSTELDPTASVSGNTVNLNSGQISIQLTNPGSLYQPTAGLVLPDAVVQNLEAGTQNLSLLSYSSIDIYGTGEVGSPSFADLTLHFSEIRGFNNGGGTVTFAAQNILLDNDQAGTFRSVVAAPEGTLEFDGGVISIGSLQLSLDQYSSELAAQAGSQASSNIYNLNEFIDQYAQLNLNATGGILLQQTVATPQSTSLQGSVVTGVLSTQGGLTITSPLITGLSAANQTIAAGGAVNIVAGGSPTVTGGLGATLTLQGASITDNANIVAPSGMITLHATGGDVTVGNLAATQLNAAGTAQTFFDLVKYTSGGEINLTSDTGNVTVGADAVVTVAAQPVGGNAGTLSISAPAGSLALDAGAQLLGQGGAGGQNGTFTLDVGTLPGGIISPVITLLEAGGFTQSISIRDRTDGSITVDGVTTVNNFNLSSDSGSITVTGTVDASGQTGGTIDIEANGNLVVEGGALLNASGLYYNDAGQGGAITLEAGNETNGNTPVATPNGNTFTGNGYLDIQAGSTIDLGVTNQLTTSDLALGNTTDNRTDLFAGTLLLRAPQTAGNTDVQINPINGTINGASTITVEGYELFNVNPTNTNPTGEITSTVQSEVLSNGQTFGGNTSAITTRLLGAVNPYGSAFIVEPGAEIINTNGNLTLGTTTSTSSSDWNLASYTFGPDNVPGVLTLRASGNLVFYNALSDGFTSSAYNSLMTAQNTLIPANAQDWSYNLTSGADFSAADVTQVLPLDTLLAGNTGSLLLGKNDGLAASTGGVNALTSTAVGNFYQVIRTGAGSIDISAGLNVELLNQFATIYTAGTLVTNAKVLPGGVFNVPVLSALGGTGFLGAVLEPSAYPAQYSFGGGNVTITAGENIEHLTQSISGSLIPDSERELPTNWLYRRGYVNPATGLFGTNTKITPPVGSGTESTTWWVDFSNFFEGVGALGGGNVTMIAGNDVANVDGVVPTNARMPSGVPNAANLVELGGGDLLVRAGNSINGGVYYVERGNGTLVAGNQIITNSTRTPSTGVTTSSAPDPSETWLPTTLFLGEGSFNVSANGSVLLGPVANPFLLPEGYSNTYWYKTYFSTYATSDAVDVSSLTGDITFREAATMPETQESTPILQNWYQYVLLLTSSPASPSFYQPWLRLDESDATPFTTEASLLPPTLRATAFSGDINVDGNLTLSPSPDGTLDLLAAGSINALQLNGIGTFSSTPENAWSASTINLSDANPATIPGPASPLAYQLFVGTASGSAAQTQDGLNFLNSINVLFNETGSVLGAAGVLQTQEALHTPGLLHANDTDPLHIYAVSGDISGLTLYSGKFSDVIAGTDITDIALYIQNDNANDVSIVDAGRDIIAYDPDSPLRLDAQEPGNDLTNTQPEAGDIQINGPGTLEVLAGRNLDTGVGPNNADGTGVGITSIGNARDPYLPFAGAQIIAGAGIGGAFGLDNSALDFTAFINQFLNPATAGAEALLYLPDLGTLLGMGGASDTDIWNAYNTLLTKNPEQADGLALDVFYIVLRDAGRDHNDPSSPDAGTYTEGYAAIAALFPGNSWQGDMTLTSREIKTQNGGDVDILDPGGQLTVGLQVAGTQPVDQGVITEDGGNINIFALGDVNVGTSRIFTLRGGNEIIWSTTGDIDAGAASKTVQAAPPTEVIVNPQSAAVQTDLAGLATGGGIGVLESVVGVPPGDVDLIAPVGIVNAGDAGIRVSGNLNISAAVVLNAGNISVGGASVGTPVAASAPSVGALTAGAGSAAATTSAANTIQQSGSGASQASTQQEIPSIITVEVLGYGGGESMNDDLQKKKETARKPTEAAHGATASKAAPPLALNDGGTGGVPVK